jgi:hypothetical protein
LTAFRGNGKTETLSIQPLEKYGDENEAKRQAEEKRTKD